MQFQSVGDGPLRRHGQLRVDNGELSLITIDGGDLSSTHNIPNEVYARYYTSYPYTQDARHLKARRLAIRFIHTHSKLDIISK
jgi:hypothetical protein